MTTTQHHQQSTSIGQVHQYVTPRRVIEAMTAAPRGTSPEKSISDQILGNPPFSGAAPTRFNA